MHMSPSGSQPRRAVLCPEGARRDLPLRWSRPRRLRAAPSAVIRRSSRHGGGAQSPEVRGLNGIKFFVSGLDA